MAITFILGLLNRFDHFFSRIKSDLLAVDLFNGVSLNILLVVLLSSRSRSELTALINDGIFRDV